VAVKLFDLTRTSVGRMFYMAGPHPQTRVGLPPNGKRMISTCWRTEGLASTQLFFVLQKI
jgi:hypothetical protein